MALNTSIIFSIFFLVLHFIDLNVAIDESPPHHDNTTDFGLGLNSGRWKRSLDDRMPAHLRIRVKYTNGEEIELNWLKKSNYLANQHLPVRSASGLLYRSVMESIGEFILYQDLEKCSSVAYFENSHSFIGHIGISHVIDELPYEFNADGNYPRVVGAPYIISRLDVLIPVQPTIIRVPLTLSEIQEDFIHSITRHRNENVKRPLYSAPGPCPKHRKKESKLSKGNSKIMTNPNQITDNKTRKRRWDTFSTTFYLETLVFITRDVAETFEKFYSRNNYKETIVRYCIRYFNAIDTVFAKAPSNQVKMHINIAKIIILDNSDLLESIEPGGIRFIETVSKLRGYLHERPSRFPPDSFDHVFMITSHQIKRNSVRVPAMTDYSSNLYQKRDEGQFYNAIPITIIEFQSSYIHGVHEIGRTLNIKIEPSVAEMEASGQCDNIMQEGSSMCNRCLKWSENSKQQLEEYFRENTNRCFLMNEPRSLRSPRPSLFVTPHQQCRCFGYQSFPRHVSGHTSGSLKPNECSVALQCEMEVNGKSIIGYILPPFDGTRCGSHKVCWGGVCTPVK